MKETREWIKIFGPVIAGCILVIIVHLLFVNHENGLMLAFSALAGLLYLLLFMSSDFRVDRRSYIGGVVVCSVVILTAVLLYLNSTTFQSRAMHKMERYAESHALEEPSSYGNKINIGDSRASYMFFTTKEGEPRILIVRETGEDLGAIEEISIPIP